MEIFAYLEAIELERESVKQGERRRRIYRGN